MYINFIILMLISIAPIVILLWYFDHLDKEHKESRRFLWSIFLWGVLITLIAGAIELVLELLFSDLFFIPMVQVFFTAFIFVAVTEETLKYWVVKRKAYDHPAFNEHFDGIVYGVVASLGFAALENILYVMEGGIYIGIIRALLAVPAHALFGAIMGYYIGLAKFAKHPGEEKLLLRKGLILAIIFHGLYDFLLFTLSPIAIFVIPLLLGLALNVRRKIIHLHFLDKIKNAIMLPKWTWWNYVKTGIGMVFFTTGVLMTFTILLYLTDDPIGQEIFTGVEFDMWSSCITIGIMWLIAYGLIRDKRLKKAKIKSKKA
ncbi:PrsW family intramembrane metalloprotease [Patescibacteria group bacterium]